MTGETRRTGRYSLGEQGDFDPVWLSGPLLILVVLRRFGEPDGEEGIDAVVDVEGFAGPAGSDGAGIGMVEPVHRTDRRNGRASVGSQLPGQCF